MGREFRVRNGLNLKSEEQSKVIYYLIISHIIHCIALYYLIY